MGFIWVFPKIMVPQNGWWKFHEKPYEQMDGFFFSPYFWFNIQASKMSISVDRHVPSESSGSKNGPNKSTPGVAKLGSGCSWRAVKCVCFKEHQWLVCIFIIKKKCAEGHESAPEKHLICFLDNLVVLCSLYIIYLYIYILFFFKCGPLPETVTTSNMTFLGSGISFSVNLHLPLLEGGVPTLVPPDRPVLFIKINFRWHHKIGDTNKGIHYL